MLSRRLRFVHPRSGTVSVSLRELYRLCTEEERGLCSAFYARYAAGQGMGGLTPFLGVRRDDLPAAWPVSGSRGTLADCLMPDIRPGSEVAVAVSGGIDCWVLAALLKSRGCTVRGWYLRSDVPGYCEWEQVQQMSKVIGVGCEEIRVTAANFIESAAAFVAATEWPVYNLHPVSKLLLARGLAARGIGTVVSGDGADQVMRQEWDCDLLPLTNACFRACGVNLVTPFLSRAVMEWCRRPDANKAPVRELARQVGVPAVPKRPTMFPDLPLPASPRAELPGIDSACLSYTTGLLLEMLEEHALCGIAGIVRPAGLEERDHATAARLLELLRHRGPDGSGIYRDRCCTLVQTRLALIGPERRLPVSSGDGRYTLVYNGEVYNFEELGLAGDGSDTEVVLAAWQRWGERSISRFNGMFSFFVWDAVEYRGFGVTDALGVKPFFYHRTPEYFAFASEAGALIESGAAPFAPDGEAIAEALVAPYFSSATRLPFAGVRRLPPGHWLEIQQGRVTVTPYYSFHHGRALPADVDAFVDQMAARVEQAVARSLRADVPVGVFLSGGVDSSLIAALSQRNSPRPVPAWTIAFEGEETADYGASLIVKSADRPYAEKAAAATGCPHRVLRVNDETFDSALGETLRANDLISAWEQEISQYLLAQAAAREVKAVLVGDAADETHFGYPFLLKPERIVSSRRVIQLFGVAPLRRDFLDDPVDHFTGRYTAFAQDRGYSWTTPCEQRLAMSCLILHLWLTRLLQNGDIQLMAHSLEGRVPFGDIRLLALAQQLPQELGYRDGIEKWHLRRVAERFLPAELAWRPKSALTKNLRAHRIIHGHFARAWRKWGAFLEPYVDHDQAEQMCAEEPRTEVDVGIRFRLLAVMTWFHRFDRSHP